MTVECMECNRLVRYAYSITSKSKSYKGKTFPRRTYYICEECYNRIYNRKTRKMNNNEDS